MSGFFKTFFVAAFFSLFVCVPIYAGNIFNVGKDICTQMQARNVLKQNLLVSCERLRIVRFSYLDLDGRVQHDGEIMVLDAAAAHVLQIFETLLNRGFRIKQARLMQHYGGDDAASMNDNNTSGFNHRQIINGTLPSLHAYGLAIDLNPMQNPYIVLNKNGHAHFSPAGGIHYANRLNLRPGKMPRQGMAEDVMHIFDRHGFSVWGGHWDNPIDYQHFQVPRGLADRLIALPAEKAKQLFEQHVIHRQKCWDKLNPMHQKDQVDLSCLSPNFP